MLRILCAAAIAVAVMSSPAGARDVLAGVTPVLAAKARELVAECGSRIIAGVAGRGRRSNHPIGRAVDVAGNPDCVYANLKRSGWRGGVSNDYHRVMCPTSRGWVRCPHVHVSWNPGGQEWGLWFAHRGPHGRGETRHAAARSEHHRPL